MEVLMQPRRPLLISIFPVLLLTMCFPCTQAGQFLLLGHNPQLPTTPTATESTNGSAATGSASLPQDPPDICPVTQPPNPPFTPPPPYSTLTPLGFWYGTASLWTDVPANGVWSGLPHNPEGYTQKVFWWRKGYDWR